jgi:predicted transcriptional regulator
VDILSALRAADRGMDDDELADVLGIDRQEVVRQCRRLAFQGIVIREEMDGERIVNKLDGGGNDGGDRRLYFDAEVDALPESDPAWSYDS